MMPRQICSTQTLFAITSACLVTVFLFTSYVNKPYLATLGRRNVGSEHPLEQSILKLHDRLPSMNKNSRDVVLPFAKLMEAPLTIEQDNPQLIQVIQEDYLYAPSTQPYNLQGGNDPSKGQSEVIRHIFGKMRDGFFIECGALDGETRSNTLYFEKELGWSGILVEGNPKNFELVQTKNRKAWAVNACLSTFAYPNKVLFKQQFNIGKIVSTDYKKETKLNTTPVQCLPVYSVMLAVNRTTIDYFSLDVEGNELEILKTIPFDKVHIKALSVEFVHTKEGRDSLRQFMESKGYIMYKIVQFPGNLANDYIFVLPQYLPTTEFNAR